MVTDNLNAVSFNEPMESYQSDLQNGDAEVESNVDMESLDANEQTSNEIESLKTAQLGLMNKIYDAHLEGNAIEYHKYDGGTPQIKVYFEYYSNTHCACYDIVKGFETYKYVFANAENADVQKSAVDQIETYFGIKLQVLNTRPILINSGHTGYDIPQGSVNNFL